MKTRKQMTTSDVKQLLQFLQLGARSNIKQIALSQILSLTATDEGIKLLISIPEALLSLLSLLSDPDESTRRNSAKALINITAFKESPGPLLDLKLERNRLIVNSPDDVVKTCLAIASNRDSEIADECLMILSNITRNAKFVEKAFDLFENSGITIDSLIEILCAIKYNRKGNDLHHLASVFSNLTQSPRMRRLILDESKPDRIRKLLPFIEYKDSLVRRRGIVAAIKNCCFEVDRHVWLLNEIDILPRLLLPLADGTEFDEDEIEDFPIELQYLPADKQREENAEIRRMLIESLNRLCALRECREAVRARNAYLVMRELHRAERDGPVTDAIENLVDVLIRKEEEIGADDLTKVEVPDDLRRRFDSLDL